MNDRWDEDDSDLTPGGPGLPPEAFSLPDAPDALRQMLLAQTSRMIRRRRWRGRVAAVGLAATAYAMGVATMAWVSNPDRRPATALVDRVEVAKIESVLVEPEYSWEETPAALFLDPEAFTLRVAEAGQDERLQLLKEGGDFYLEVQGDVRVATVCYERLLDGLSEGESIGLRPSDTWLLRGLKSGRMEEWNDDENVG